MLKFAALFGASLLALLAGLALWIDSQSTPDLAKSKLAEAATASPGAIYSAKYVGSDGASVSLGRWSDKLLVLNFWATWCAPCKEEIPVLNDIQKRFSPKGLQIVGIAADSALNVANFSKEIPLGYPVFADESGAIELSRRLGNRLGLLPFTAVVQPGGEVLWVRMGAVRAQELEEIAGKYSPKSPKLN